MNVLQQIVARKKREVEERKTLYPVQLLERSIHFKAPTVSMKKYVKDPSKSGIIAEFKRKSPSHPDINPYADIRKVSTGYMRAGASALSILTDETGFGGKNEDLTTARLFNYCPILRKDFVIDEYQVLEARSIGADCILLIAEVLAKKEVQGLTALAQQLGMEVLLEMHSLDQLEKVIPDIDLIGVNNRNLKTLKINLKTALQAAEQLPNDKVKIAESGIQSAVEMEQLKKAGFDGFLIGQTFMEKPDPVKACKQFIDQYARV